MDDDNMETCDLPAQPMDAPCLSDGLHSTADCLGSVAKGAGEYRHSHQLQEQTD